MGAPAADTLVTKSAFTSQASVDFGAASGTTTSGTGNLSALTGPWYIVRQDLNITYVRVPTQRGASGSVTLDQVTTTNGSIEKTEIIYFCNARVEARVVELAFNASAVQQPQEFTFNAASGGPNGVTYGAISGGVTMGPMGTIISSKPFISRTLYQGVVSAQPEFNKSIVASNWAAYYPPAMQGNSVLSEGETVNAAPYMYDLAFHKDDGCMPGTHRDGHPYNFTGGKPTSYATLNDYIIPGAYATNKESVADLQAFLDGVANNLTSESLHRYPISNEETIGNLTIPARDVGLSEYDINRHA